MKVITTEMALSHPAVKELLSTMTATTQRIAKERDALAKDAAYALRKAIQQEEAQTVEPAGIIVEAGGMMLELDFYRDLPAGTLLYTHPAPAADPATVTCQIYGHVVGVCGECNTHTEPAKLPENCGTGYCSCVECVKPAKPSAGKPRRHDYAAFNAACGKSVKPLDDREALIYRSQEMAKAMTSYGYAGCADLCLETSDMLAADAQEIEELESDYTDQVLRAMKAEEALAQQVAVPMGWKLVPVKPTYEMLAAFRDCNIPSGSYAFEDYNDQLDWEHGYDYSAILAAAPQPPQKDSK